MTKAIAHTYSIAHEYRIQITSALFATCALLVVLYAINVYVVISRTISLQQTESQVSAIGSQVAQLDAQYLTLSGDITPVALKSHGFNQGQASLYIPRTDSIGRIALGGHEL